MPSALQGRTLTSVDKQVRVLPSAPFYHNPRTRAANQGDDDEHIL